MINVFHIGTIAFETKDTKRELKSIGGISGYIKELIEFSLSENLKVSFIGRIYNFNKNMNLNYFEIQEKITSTNKFLIHLFFKSFLINIPANSIIHAHRPDHLAVFMFSKKKKSVITLHGQQARTINIRKSKVIRTIYRFMETYAFSKTNALIAVDNITKEFYSKLYPQHRDKIYTIPTGVNTKIFYPLDREKSRKLFGFTAKHKIILYVGRIEPPKKLDDIIRAFQLMVNNDDNYRLVVVGDGVLFKNVKELSTKLQLNKFINFLGVRKRNELPEIFSMADISVLYSGNEGSPLSVKESLACGIPVVANNVGDIPVVIRSGYNGYIVEEENIKELAKTMQLAVENSKSMKDQCVSSIIPYTTEKVSQQVIDLYKSILDE